MELAGNRGIDWPDREAKHKFEEMCDVIQKVVQEKEMVASNEVENRIMESVRMHRSYSGLSFLKSHMSQVGLTEGASNADKILAELAFLKSVDQSAVTSQVIYSTRPRSIMG